MSDALAKIAHYAFTHTWWWYDPAGDWYALPYHWINLIEGAAWMAFTIAVLARFAMHRKSAPLELLYALAFFTFGLSDFREAYVVQSWLILFKGANLVALLYLRWRVTREHYPDSKTF